jgi:BirA family biotin operon repressor/biotin-[acetyl-CoA-carboxylase] ligase
MEINAAILSLLRENRGWVSGEMMSGLAGVSRVSIWKHVQCLKSLGYQIEVSPKGYRLAVDSNDMLFSWEFPGMESKVHFYRDVDSTMTIARRLADQGGSRGSLVIAEKQRAGRGRDGRSWISEKGGLYFTWLLSPKVPLPLGGRILIGASVALARTLNRKYGLQTRLKWPNDVMIGVKKVAGMLADTVAESDLISRCNLGVGVNVNNRPAVAHSCSLSEVVGRPLSRRELLVSFLHEFERTRTQYMREDLVSEWKSLSSTIGQRVKIATPRGTVTGNAVDIDSTGALVVEEKGQRHTLFYGDCHHIGRSDL